MPKTPDRAVLNGLVEERASPAWTATYEHSWQRDRETWRAVMAAVTAGLNGARPATPRPSPPRWLVGLTRRRLEEVARRSSHPGAFDGIRPALVAWASGHPGGGVAGALARALAIASTSR